MSVALPEPILAITHNADLSALANRFDEYEEQLACIQLELLGGRLSTIEHLSKSIESMKIQRYIRNIISKLEPYPGFYTANIDTCLANLRVQQSNLSYAIMQGINCQDRLERVNKTYSRYRKLRKWVVQSIAGEPLSPSNSSSGSSSGSASLPAFVSGSDSAVDSTFDYSNGVEQVPIIYNKAPLYKPKAKRVGWNIPIASKIDKRSKAISKRSKPIGSPKQRIGL